MTVTIFGTPISTYHALIVELHTGIAVFAFLALVVMVLVDIVARIRHLAPTEQMQVIKRDADAIAYLGSLGTVFFLILSGITGFLIEPYSVLSTTPLLLNKSLVALAALYFWTVYAFVRYWEGPGLWKKAGLYLFGVATMLLGMLFLGLAGSIGGELSPYGGSVMDPLYKMLNFSWRNFKLTQNDVYLTLGLVVVAIVIVGFLSMRGAGGSSRAKVPVATK